MSRSAELAWLVVVADEAATPRPGELMGWENRRVGAAGPTLVGDVLSDIGPGPLYRTSTRMILETGAVLAIPRPPFPQVSGLGR